jgi:hypothetical protein
MNLKEYFWFGVKVFLTVAAINFILASAGASVPLAIRTAWLGSNVPQQ